MFEILASSLFEATRPLTITAPTPRRDWRLEEEEYRRAGETKTRRAGGYPTSPSNDAKTSA